MDRSAPASMKNAANCVNQCELQDTLIIDVSNAHGGSGSLPEPRPVEGRLLPKREFADSSASRTVPRSFESAAVSDLARKTESDLRVLSRGPRVLGGRFHDRPPHGPVDLGSPLMHLSVFFFSRPQLGRDDPLNLSILLRGGKENNDDSLSKGD